MLDIDKIPKHLKTLLINSVLLPFWYISIYIFHHEFYKNDDFLIIASVCIGLTIVSSLLTSIILTRSEKDTNILEENVVIPTVAIQVILLSLIIFLGYLFKVFFGKIFHFYGFLLTYFGIIISILFLDLISGKNNPEKK
ncbi:hypothetical protein [Winogradskyella alexanderae]|uniref:Uncharacterized protein n=1 Tax=Winogradskyella alexanderae TaxID=2877123 RepID=A0ABS7XV68_9FLAO|nr:hypothetical protein [Winogradskyella alexanderae]MCA0133922.1 hypothetical protein [Winogradskyella alexanderae]